MNETKIVMEPPKRRKSQDAQEWVLDGCYFKRHNTVLSVIIRFAMNRAFKKLREKSKAEMLDKEQWV